MVGTPRSAHSGDAPDPPPPLPPDPPIPEVDPALPPEVDPELPPDPDPPAPPLPDDPPGMGTTWPAQATIDRAPMTNDEAKSDERRCWRMTLP
jgi:hypothetical protein